MGLKAYVGASAALMAVGLGIAWYAFGRPAVASAGTDTALSIVAGPDVALDPGVGDPAAPSEPPANDLEGEAYISTGEFDKALRWADLRLKSNAGDDAVLLIKAQALSGLNRKEEAGQLLSTLIAKGGEQSGDAMYTKAMLEPADRISAALEETWRKSGATHGGMKAAKEWADRRYNEVIKVTTGEGWEDLRDAYSVVLYGHLLSTAEEKPIVDRLNTLNKWLLFNPGSTMKSPAVTVHTVGSGEALSVIARKYVVPVFRIQRINKIEDARRIRVGQKLRIITGVSEVFADKSDFVLTIFMDQKFISRYDIGIGKDDGTPEGAFKVVTKDWNPDWYYQGKRYAFGDPQNILGVAWLGLDAPSGSASIGIHGSPDGDGIGKKSSKGCIRLRNPDVAEVYDWVTIGSAVTIAP